jgi:hypothetical protein
VGSMVRSPVEVLHKGHKTNVEGEKIKAHKLLKLIEMIEGTHNDLNDYLCGVCDIMPNAIFVSHKVDSLGNKKLSNLLGLKQKKSTQNI